MDFYYNIMHVCLKKKGKAATDEVKKVTARRVLQHLNAHTKGSCALSAHNHD